MKLSGLTKMVKRQLVCNVFHNDESDDFYIGTASAIYCATGFPRPLNRNQMGAMLGISEDTMIEKVVYNDFDCAYKIDFQGFNLDDTIKDEVEVKKLGIGIYCSGEILIPLVTEDRHMVGIICQSHLAPLEDEIKNNGFIRYYQRKQTDGTVYYVVKNGMRVRAAVMAYTVPDYAEAKLQELVAMLAETHIGEQEEPEQTFDDLNAEKGFRAAGVIRRRNDHEQDFEKHNFGQCEKWRHLQGAGQKVCEAGCRRTRLSGAGKGHLDENAVP